MSIVAVLEGAGAAILKAFEADGKAVETFIITESQKLVAALKSNTGFLGIVATAIHDVEDGTKTGAQKFEEVVGLAVPELIKIVTSGQSAFAVIETDIFNLAREAVQSVYNDMTGTPAAAILNSLGVSGVVNATLAAPPAPVGTTPPAATPPVEAGEAVAMTAPATPAETEGDGA